MKNTFSPSSDPWIKSSSIASLRILVKDSAGRKMIRSSSQCRQKISIER
jgi:hypothetical protein